MCPPVAVSLWADMCACTYTYSGIRPPPHTSGIPPKYTYTGIIRPPACNKKHVYVLRYLGLHPRPIQSYAIVQDIICTLSTITPFCKTDHHSPETLLIGDPLPIYTIPVCLHYMPILQTYTKGLHYMPIPVHYRPRASELTPARDSIPSNMPELRAFSLP